MRRTFVGKVMSLLLNMLSRLVITFLPRSKHLLISWLQSPSAVIFLVIWLHFMVHLSEHLVLKKVYPAVLSLMTQTALWGPAPKIAVLGLGYSLGVSQSAQEMPGLRTIDFISYIGQLVLVVKNPPANAGDVRDAGSIPGLGRSLEEGMSTHSSTLAWRTPRTEEPGGLWSIGWQPTEVC